MEDEEFRDAARVFMTFMLSYIATFLISTLIIRSKNDMNFWQTIIVTLISAIGTGLITFFATSYGSRRSQIQKNTEALERLSRQLGVGDEQTLKKYIDGISDDIGRNGESSLTKQHTAIINTLEKDIEASNRRYEDEEGRIRNFTLEQHNIAETIEDFRLFMDSWERLTADINTLNAKVLLLEDENKELKKTLQEIRNKRKL